MWWTTPVARLPHVATKSLRLAVLGGLLATTAFVAPVGVARAADEDVPKRLPALAWELEIACGPCSIAAADDAVYVLEHSIAGGTSIARLSRLDIATGDVVWEREIGPAGQLTAYDDIVIVNDKTHFEVYDAETGASRFGRDGTIAAVNRFQTVLLSDGGSVTALDPVDGHELWSRPGTLGAWCRDIAVVVPAAGAPAEPFAVIDHRSGEERWASDEPFDPATDAVTCGYGPYVYTADGEEVTEWDAYIGWLNWTADVPGAAGLEIYREVALVGTDQGTTVAVERETGEVLWELPQAEVGIPVSIIGRVREDGTGVFTLHPLTGAIVNHTTETSGTPFEVVTSSETRVVLASGSVVTAYGMNDLGVAWQLDLGAPPDELAVASGYLVARTGDILRGYS
jgi:outer membrane protein assembly factor BamB